MTTHNTSHDIISSQTNTSERNANKARRIISNSSLTVHKKVQQRPETVTGTGPASELLAWRYPDDPLC